MSLVEMIAGVVCTGTRRIPMGGARVSLVMMMAGVVCTGTRGVRMGGTRAGALMIGSQCRQVGSLLLFLVPKVTCLLLFALDKLQKVCF